jgi:thioredoxin reductase (NADPH)
MPVRDLLIIGAGPSGLSAAIAAKQRGLDYQVVERGALVNSIFNFPPQMVFFTTPELLEIGGLPFVSPYDKPTRPESLRYYRKVVDTYDLSISFEETVLSVDREESHEASGTGEAGAGEAIFVVETRSSRGVRRVRHARNVIFAIGILRRAQHAERARRGSPARPSLLRRAASVLSAARRHRRRRQLGCGMGAGTVPRGRVTIVHRHPELKKTISAGSDRTSRTGSGRIGHAARFNAHLTEIRPTSVIIRSGGSGGSGEAGEEEALPADAVFLLTGYHADWDLMERAGIVLGEKRVPYDHETFETNVPGLFLAGGAICGRD